MSRFYWFLTVLYCAGLFVLSSDSTPYQMDNVFPAQDKLAHMVLFGGLSLVVAVGLRRAGTGTARFQFLAPVLFVIFYGFTDEIHQYFVPNRHFELLDIVADTVGALLVQSLVVAMLWAKGKALGKGIPARAESVERA